MPASNFSGFGKGIVDMHPYCFSGDLQKARESFKTKFMFNYLCFGVNQNALPGGWNRVNLCPLEDPGPRQGCNAEEVFFLGLACSTVQGCRE